MSNYDHCIIHNSAIERFRSPLGAVPCGTKIRLSVEITGIDYKNAWLTVYNEGLTTDLELIKTAPKGDGALLSANVVTADEPAVLWYWFNICLSDGSIIHYGAIGNDLPNIRLSSIGSGIGKVYPNSPPAFQLTVYDENLKTPEWSKNGVLYQIFPDRYRRSSKDRVTEGLEHHRAKGREDLYLHENWDDMPDHRPREGKDHYIPGDLFGGDIPGITEDLPRLAEMGVTILSLNPIFEAASNHRYNTADYRKIDPCLGTDEDFTELVSKADQLGIKLILDGVFSHTGDDSVYFDKYGRYGVDAPGAYASKESPWYSWYSFSDFPDHYKSWWGFDTLPEVDEQNENWVDYVIKSNDSVINSWMNRGIGGFRLDVADELPDETIEEIKNVLRCEGRDGFLIGEVWEDATSKKAYGKNRKYALGRGLDSVMNYPFREATIQYLKGEITAIDYQRILVSQNQGYPREMYYSLMNLLSSHDVTRIRTRFESDENPRELSRDEQAEYSLIEMNKKNNGTAGDSRFAKLHRLAAAIQFTIPGIPSVYYGDEVGMTGMLDPFNRMPFSIFDQDMEFFYKGLADTRKNHPVLRTGGVLFYSTDENVLGIFRYSNRSSTGIVDVFGNSIPEDHIFTIINPTDKDRRIVIDLKAEKEGAPAAQLDALHKINFNNAHLIFSSEPEPKGDGSCGSTCGLKDGLLDISIPTMTAEIYKLY